MLSFYFWILIYFLVKIVCSRGIWAGKWAEYKWDICIYIYIYIYRWFHAKSPPPLALFSAKKGGGDLERRFDFQPISAKKGGGGLSAPFIFFGENRV